MNKYNLEIDGKNLLVVETGIFTLSFEIIGNKYKLLYIRSQDRMLDEKEYLKIVSFLEKYYL